MRLLLLLMTCYLLSNFCCCGKLKEVFTWKQIDYDYNGILYTNDSDTQRTHSSVYFTQELDSKKFFIRYNNVPIGLEVYGHKIFVTVPRRKYGIPSTLNYVDRNSSSPALKPYPDVKYSKSLISVYRPRVDSCDRLWLVDTGLMEIPNDRRQVKPPRIIVFDLKTNKEILKYELKTTDLVNERTTGGLTSITVDVNPVSCNEAYAYINDLATNGLIVFSMKDRDSWRIEHSSFVHDDKALNFTVAGNLINWMDGLFSIALSDPQEDGTRTAYYHPLVATQEYSVNTVNLKSRVKDIGKFVNTLGNRGPLTQSGSHDYHAGTRTLLFGNVAQDAILCWNVDTPLTPENVAIVVQDHEKLVYISDLKVVADDVWVLVNQIPRFVYSTLNPMENNYYVHMANIPELIRGTICERK